MKQKHDKTYFKGLLQLFLTFFKIGLFTFGGGYAMLALISEEVVERRKWISKSELGDIFAIAESTPGPIAINTATFIGTSRLGIFGGIMATLGVVLPSFIIISCLSLIIGLVKDNVWVGYLFKGIRIGVLVLILKAVFTFFKDMRKNLISFVLMTAAFALVFFLNVDVIYLILATIVLMSVIVALSHAYKKRIYFIKGTPEYYSEKLGRVLEKDEYYSEKALNIDKINIKTTDYANSDISSSANHNQFDSAHNGGEGGEE